MTRSSRFRVWYFGQHFCLPAAGCALFLTAVSPPLQGQDYARADALHTELLPAGLDTKHDGEGFLFGVGVNGIYDSNVFLEEDDEESDFSIAASPWVLFNSSPPGGARYRLSARYAPFIRAFFDNSDLNSFDHSGNASLSYEGEKLTMGVDAAYSRISQADRLAGTFAEGSSFSFGASGSYHLSRKTFLSASWGAALSDYESDRLASTDSYSAQVTAFWEATPLLRIGPSVRHSEMESNHTGDREAWALLLRLNYELTGKVSLSASGGVEWEEYDRAGGDTETRFTGGLDAHYTLDALWSFTAGVDYRTIASPSNRGYSVDDLQAALSVTRRLGSGSLRGGVSAAFSDYQPVGPVATRREDEETVGAFISHRISLFEDRVDLDSSIRYSSNDGQQDWDRFQFSTGFNYNF